MKHKPLKNKKDTHYPYQAKPYKVFYPRDVKSAVEWLKEQFKLDDQDLYTSSSVHNKIDKAFEDVTK